MYSPKEQQETGNTALPNLPLKPIWAAKRRRQLHPFFFRMGPVTLGITSVLLVGLMAVLYLSQLGQAVAANQQIQGLHAQQDVLQRQNQDLVDSLAQEQSPAYIAEQAKKQGLIPADPKVLQIVVVSHLKPIPDQNHDQYIKP